MLAVIPMQSIPAHVASLRLIPELENTVIDYSRNPEQNLTVTEVPPW